MINLSCAANKQNKRGVSLLFAFLTPFLLLFLAFLMTKDPSIWIEVGLFVSVCVLLWYVLRYQLCTFVYAIEGYEEDEAPELLVYSVQGRRKSLLVRMPLSQLREMRALTFATRKTFAREKKHSRACYNLMPDNFLRLRFQGAIAYMTVDIEADEPMRLYLENYLLMHEREETI